MVAVCGISSRERSMYLVFLLEGEGPLSMYQPSAL